MSRATEQGVEGCGMDSQRIWQAALQECRAAGIDALPLDAPLTDAAWELLADAQPPPAVRAFADEWVKPEPEPWEALVRGAEIVNPRATQKPPELAVASCLRSLIERSEYAAVAYGQTTDWTSPDQWAYLVQISQTRDTLRHLLVHPPAPDADVARAENVFNLRLPPGYREFLSLTNGLGFGPAEDRFICGAGPGRALWKPVLLNAWLECAGQHEVTALWREFQGSYAYERIQDRERGQNSFLSDETALVPFAVTNAIWCFDSTRPSGEGEYPIVFWDHEVRQARTIYPDFAAWFADQMEVLLPRAA